MVYVQAARKTGAFMLLSGVLSIGILTFMTEPMTSTPTGRAVTATNVVGSNWLIFVLGIFMGCLMVGTYFYVAHLEAKREE